MNIGRTGSSHSGGTRTHSIYFDWRTFLREYRIPFDLQEHRGWGVLRCPFCGTSDRGHDNMGVSLDPRNPGWTCWRSKQHRGHDPTRLIQKLLGCNKISALAIIQASVARIEPQAISAPAPVESRPTELRWPDNIRPLDHLDPLTQPFFAYLERRGFTLPLQVAERYGLRYCLTGPYAWRLVIPIYDEQDTLVTWTGRDVRGDAKNKYKSLSTRPYPDEPLALLKTDEVLYNANLLQAGGDMLVITEGPFDGMKVDWSMRARTGIHATSIFTNQLTLKQLAKLNRVIPKYKQILVLLDADARVQARELLMQLRAFWPSYPVKSVHPPPPYKDPGDMPIDVIEALITKQLH